jgi:CRP/FNR family transcriptional regulator
MPGDLLGLSAVISGSPFEVTAEALMPVFADTIRRDDFLSFLSRHGEASMHTAKTLSDAYKSAFFDARRFALSDSVAARVASILLDWGKASSDGDAEMHFTMALSREDFASFVGTTRETVTRVLVIFQKKKLIRIRGISLYILLPDELSQLCA